MNSYKVTLFLIAILLMPIFADRVVAAENFDFTRNIFLASPTGHDADLSKPLLYRLVKFVGKFHVLIIHFPIAFLAGACVCQWWFVKKGSAEKIATVMLWFGAIGAIGAACLGWAYAYNSGYVGEKAELLFLHRWLGTSTASIAILVVIFKTRLSPVRLAIALTLCAILVGIAGHFGGSLVYGADFFTDF